MRKRKTEIKKMIATALSVVTAMGMLPQMGVTAKAAGNEKSSTVAVPDGMVLVSQTDYALSPGLVEQDFVTQDTNGDHQNLGYVVSFDPTDSNIGVKVGYKNMNPRVNGLATVMDQAKALEKTGENVVLAVNGDSFNMSTGESAGALISDGQEYHDITYEPYIAIMEDGSCQIRESYTPVGSGVKEAIGAMMTLVRNGAVAAEIYAENDPVLYPETLCGVKANGEMVIMSIDGRQAPISGGFTHLDSAKTLVAMGCVQAVKLDGGGSTTFITKREGTNSLKVQNKPSDKVEREVGTTLMVYSKATADGTFDHASITPTNEIYTPNSSVEFKATGVDGSGAAADLPADLSWKLADESFGTIDGNGKFVSTGKVGEVKVFAQSGGKTVGNTTIQISGPDSITFANKEVSLGFNKSSDLGIIVKKNGRTINYKDGDIIWQQKTTTEGKESIPLGTFSDNIFTAGDKESIDGEVTAVSAFDSDVSGSIAVRVGVLPKVVMDFEDQKDADGNVISSAKDFWNFSRVVFDASRGEILGRYIEGGVDTVDRVAKTNLVTGHYCNNSDPTNSRGGEESAEIVDILSNEPVRFGNNSLKLNYDFSKINGIEGACVGFSSQSQEIEGSPTAIGMWVYAPEGTPNLWLRIRVKDGGDNTLTLDFTDKMTDEAYNGINWTGWKYVEAKLENNGQPLKGPFKLIGGETIRVMHTFSAYGGMGNYLQDGTQIDIGNCKGSIYVDNLRFVYGTNIDDITNPVIQTLKINNQNVEDGETINTNQISISSMFADAEAEVTTGIDADTVHLLIDGEDMSKTSGYYSNDCEIKDDVTLLNGSHTIKVLVRDKFGNETTKTTTINVEGEDKNASISFEADQESKPTLGSEFKLNMVTDKLEDVKKVTSTISVNKEFTDYKVVGNDNYDVTGSYDGKGTITLEATKKAGVTVSGNGIVASITCNVPYNASKSTLYTYAVTNGKITYSQEIQGLLTTFSQKKKSISVDADLTMDFSDMVVGKGATVSVKDADGNVVPRAKIYASDGTLIGTCNYIGTLDISDYCETVKTYSLYAEKDGKYSFIYSGQSYQGGDTSDAVPYAIMENAVADSSTSKDITWMANIGYSEAKAQIMIATKEDYEAKQDEALLVQEGTSNKKTFSGSSIATENKIVRINHVKLVGLQGGTTYVYKVGDGKTWSTLREFKVNRANTDTNMFIIGDTQAVETTNIDRIIQNLKNSGINYNLGIQTGDLLENAALYDDWKKGCNIFSAIPGVDLLHTIGNHEQFGDSDIEAASLMYSLTDKHHYSVKYGNVYVATLSFTGSEKQLTEDLEWLVEDAANTDARWKILTLHVPAYFSNPTSEAAMMNRLLPPAAQKAGIDVVFSGHDHSYERILPVTDGEVDEKNGVTYYICGSTGEKSYAAIKQDGFKYAPLLDKENPYTGYEAIYLTLSTTDTDLKVETHELDGTVIDTYSKSKENNICKNGHTYEYDNGYLVCSECGYAEPVGDFSGKAIDKATGKMMFFIQGEKLTKKWHSDGADDTYYLGADGLAVTGEYVIGGKTYTFDESGKFVKGAFVNEEIDGKTITKYYGAGGSLEVQWNEIDGDVYYFLWNGPGDSHTGEMLTGEHNLRINNFTVEKRTFVFGDDGKLIKGAFDTVKEDGNYAGTRYYWGNKFLTGDQIIEGSTYHFDDNGYMAVKNISDCTVSIDKDSFVYDGGEKKPVVVVKDGDRVLTENTEYTVTYGKNVTDVTNSATVTVTGKDSYKGSVEKTFKITQYSLDEECKASLDTNLHYYTGSAIKAEVTVKHGEKTLVNGTDYTVTYKNNTNAGTATATVNGIGAYVGSMSLDFTIVKASIRDNCSIQLDSFTHYYTGNEIKAGATVEFAGNTLKQGTDYTVEYSNNTNVGTATITFNGIGKYTGTITHRFMIVRASLGKDCKVKLQASKYFYTGKEIQADVIVTLAGKTLKKDIDYSVSYKNNTKVGTATVIIEGIGAYEGTYTDTFAIAKASVKNDCTVKIGASKYYYTGKAINAGVSVKLGTKTLKKGTDYAVTYKNNIKVGTATVTVTGMGIYTGTVDITYTIAKTSVKNDCTVKIGASKYYYTGKAINAGVSVKLGTKTLKKGTDYAVTYKNNIKVGTATVTITGKGIYTGKVSKTYKIVKRSIADKKYVVKLSASKYNYTGKNIKPVVTIKGLKLNKDFTVAYKNNKKIGTATVTVKGKGIYAGTVTKTFKICKKIAAPKAATITAKKTSVTMKWSKVSGAKSYIVYKYSIKTKKATKYKVTKNTSITISKLKANTQYTYRVCASSFADGSLRGFASKVLTIRTSK